MKTAKQLHKKWIQSAEYKEAYDEFEEEYSVARALIEARTKAKLTQSQVAEKMETSQAAVARLEAGSGNPSLATLKRYAKATGSRLQIELKSKSKRYKVKPFESADVSDVEQCSMNQVADELESETNEH